MGRIDKIPAGIFECRSNPKHPVQEPITMSKAHWKHKKGAERKYLPKPPPPQLAAARWVTKARKRPRNRVKEELSPEAEGDQSPYPIHSENQEEPQKARMEWFSQTDQAPMDGEDWEGRGDTPWEQPEETEEGGWEKTWEEEQEEILENEKKKREVEWNQEQQQGVQEDEWASEEENPQTMEQEMGNPEES